MREERKLSEENEKIYFRLAQTASFPSISTFVSILLIVAIYKYIYVEKCSIITTKISYVLIDCAISINVLNIMKHKNKI